MSDLEKGPGGPNTRLKRLNRVERLRPGRRRYLLGLADGTHIRQTSGPKGKGIGRGANI